MTLYITQCKKYHDSTLFMAGKKIFFRSEKCLFSTLFFMREKILYKEKNVFLHTQQFSKLPFSKLPKVKKQEEMKFYS